MIKRQVTHTTLGDLIDALTTEISWYVEDEKEASILVAYVLSNLLAHQNHGVNC